MCNIGYDYSVSTFSPNGRVFQVEYASKAVEKSGTAIGIQCSDGIVLGVEIPVINKMIIKNSNKRIYSIDQHIGMVSSGLVADARQLVNKSREECTAYYKFYGELIPSNIINERLSNHVHMHTLYWYLRPFGCSVIMGVYGDNGPALYSIEPSGVSYKYYACAIGKNKQGAASELENIKFNEITCKDGIKHIARILYKLHDESKDKELELELSWISNDTQRKHQLVPDQLRDQAIQEAIESKRQAEMGDDE